MTWARSTQAQELHVFCIYSTFPQFLFYVPVRITHTLYLCLVGPQCNSDLFKSLCLKYIYVLLFLQRRFVWGVGTEMTGAMYCLMFSEFWLLTSLFAFLSLVLEKFVCQTCNCRTITFSLAYNQTGATGMVMVFAMGLYLFPFIYCTASWVLHRGLH